MASRSMGRARPYGEALLQPSRLRAALAALGPDGRTDGWRGFSSQVLLLTPPALLYFLVRDLSAGQEREAFANAASIVDLQTRQVTTVRCAAPVEEG